MDMVGMGPSFFFNEEGLEGPMHPQATPECYIITLPTRLLGYANDPMSRYPMKSMTYIKPIWYDTVRYIIVLTVSY